jgi:large subunit ribosomal protein L25
VGENSIVVERREGIGKGVARKLRMAGRVPGVVYGRGRDTVAVTFDPLPLERALRASEAGMNTLFDLELRGDAGKGERVVLVKELQRDPVTGRMLHADLYEVDLTRTVEVEVPIHLVGVPKGVSLDGGILDHALRQLRIECLPRAIPDELTLDVSELAIGDSLHVRDIVLPEGVALVDDGDLSVASVVAPQKEEVAAPVAAEGVPVEGAPAEGAAPAAEGAAPAAGGGDEE